MTKTTTIVCTPLEFSKANLIVMPGEVKKQAEERLKSPALIDSIIDDVHALGIAGEDDLILIIYLIGTSRLLDNPLSGLVMGESSSGKSYVISTVTRLFPKETVLKAHVISPKAFLRIEQGTLEHRFVVAGERSRKQDESTTEVTRLWRELVSDGELNASIAIPDSEKGWTAPTLNQKGPISYIESTTLKPSEIFDEDRTRFILLKADESIEQTHAVIELQARSASNPVESKEHNDLIQVHHAMQRMLSPVDVVIPFAEKLTDSMPYDKVFVRRAFSQMLGLIKATALLHQFQRSRDDKGRIIASVDDYKIIKERFSDILARPLGGVLSSGAVALLEIILNRPTPPYSFSLSDLIGKVNYKETKLRSHMKELLNAGQIKELIKATGNKPANYNVPRDRTQWNILRLPEL